MYLRHGKTGPNYPGFDTTKDIEVPNDFIIVNKNY
tara:strand:+ start:2056 stop:2160 length:105 start_codon:yes stop_codon:yes gene_type:complete